MNLQLFIFDCLNGKLRASDAAFMSIGREKSNTFPLLLDRDNAGSFAQRAESCRFFPHNSVETYSVNGETVHGGCAIHPKVLYLFVLAGGCFLVWYGDADERPDFSLLRPQRWYLYESSRQLWHGPVGLDSLEEAAAGLQAGDLASFEGLDNKAFYLRDILPCAAFYRSLPPKEGQRCPEDDTRSHYCCPHCRELFEVSQALSISCSPELCGDALLGPDAPLRFHASEFDANGIALDNCRKPSPDFACPHCHMKLPPFFAQLPQHMISLVGLPGAGKSYYIAALLRELKIEMARDFGMPFRDADPAENAPINDMSLRLFSACSPQEAYIGKTRLQGRLYEKVWKHGRMTNMPRPFIFNLSGGKRSCSVTLYDNAGENFEPGRDEQQRLAADHLSMASCVLFLFDPTVNSGFRAMLKDNPDPQLRHTYYQAGSQTSFLAETEMRIRRSLNLTPERKLDVPLAVLVGKCDLWAHFLGPEPLLPLRRNGKFLNEHVNINSARVRQLLFSIAPNICSNAEAISNNVRYFAVSALGASPVEFVDDSSGAIFLGPASGENVRPIRVTDPLLWGLYAADPALFPSLHHS